MQIDLETIKLTKGVHNSYDDGMCIMEAVAYYAREPFSDNPACVSPVLGAFLRSWNDSVDDEFRQKLKPFIPRLVGTANDSKDEARAWLATDWLVRVCAPAWLDLAKQGEHAMALRTAKEINGISSANNARPSIDAARDAAGAAAWAAARDAAWAAAGDAAWAAARAAAGTAAWTAAWAAAWDAAASALQPTVELLQASALELLDRMIEVPNAN